MVLFGDFYIFFKLNFKKNLVEINFMNVCIGIEKIEIFIFGLLEFIFLRSKCYCICRICVMY